MHAYQWDCAALVASGVDIDDYRKAVTARRRERLDALLAGGPPHEQQVHLVEGWAGDVIPAVVRRQRIDLIVMGTLARVGIPGLFIGNTAERTLDHVECDVLAIKPEGFVTPVQLPEQA